MPVPQYCPSPRELDDLELLLSGALAPRTTFDDVVRLDLPADLADADEVELVDPEGLPLARWTRTSLTALSVPTYGPFRQLHLTPAESRERHPDSLLVPVAGPLTDDDLHTMVRLGEDSPRRHVTLLALSGHGTVTDLTPVGLLRATLVAAGLLRERGLAADVVAAPLPAHGDAEVDHALGQLVVGSYATGEVVAPTGRGALPAAIAAVVAQDQPADDERGLVVFFTGLSGSGKSTIARLLHDTLLEDGRRTVTSLDGDVVRRNLSAGLTFSKADRETNIRRIGWVGAEIGRHRGVAICSPIAPYDATRRQVRAYAEEAGAIFVLVHVATPLEECERRDRKGLYAKARAGEIPEFTGISSPYEEPDDADVRIDTTGRDVRDCLDEVLAVLPLDLSTPSSTPSSTQDAR